MPPSIPFEPQDGHGIFDCLGHLRNCDCKPLKEHREATVRIGPRYRDRRDSMCWTFDPGYSCNRDGLELAGIHVSPLALFSKVVPWELMATVWAAELGCSWMIDLNSELLSGCVELHVGDLPWSAQAEDVLVELFVLHCVVPFPEDSTITHRKHGWTQYSNCCRM